MCKHLSSRVKMIWLRSPSPWTFSPRQGPTQRMEHRDSSPLSSGEQAGSHVLRSLLRFSQVILCDRIVGLLPRTLGPPVPQQTWRL